MTARKFNETQWAKRVEKHKALLAQVIEDFEAQGCPKDGVSKRPGVRWASLRALGREGFLKINLSNGVLKYKPTGKEYR